MKKTLSKDGTLIAFDQSGQGPALILVTGAIARRTDAARLAASLSPNFTVISYDRRGRGESGDTPPYAVEREVEDLDALITEAGGAAFVFGHSSGAVLALEAARLLPTRITKLALYEPPFIIDDSRPPVPEGSARHLAHLVSSGRRGEAVEYFMTQVGTPTEAIAQMRQAPVWSGFEAVAHTLAYDMTIVEDTERGAPSPLRKWATVTVPTLVMDGTVFLGREENHAFLRHGAQALTSILPHAQHRILEGQDHGPADDVLAPALVEFFL